MLNTSRILGKLSHLEEGKKRLLKGDVDGGECCSCARPNLLSSLAATFLLTDHGLTDLSWHLFRTN